MGWVAFFENFIQIACLLFAWALVILAFFILAIQLFVTLIEFKLSTLAGFVEAGESLEHAVRRGVAEETGVLVGDVSYRGSQPWPFPASLMIGFRVRALSTDVTVDGVELTEARWFSRAELAEAVRTTLTRALESAQ